MVRRSGTYLLIHHYASFFFFMAKALVMKFIFKGLQFKRLLCRCVQLYLVLSSHSCYVTGRLTWIGCCDCGGRTLRVQHRGCRDPSRGANEQVHRVGKVHFDIKSDYQRCDVSFDWSCSSSGFRLVRVFTKKSQPSFVLLMWWDFGIIRRDLCPIWLYHVIRDNVAAFCFCLETLRHQLLESCRNWLWLLIKCIVYHSHVSMKLIRIISG